MTIVALATTAQQTLEAAGFTLEDARRDVSVLARWLLGWDHAEWLRRRHEQAPSAFPAKLSALVARRACHQPIAYLVGEREFYGRAFVVTRAVLIPRPETEFIVDEALIHLSRRGPADDDATVSPAGPQAVSILDVGTGSGCLAITLALECPEAHILATEISPAALDVAQANTERWGVADRVTCVLGALTAGQTSVDLIVSNPPYIAETDRRSLPPDVVDFEPSTALFGGHDGLAVIRDLVPAAARALRPGGMLVMEIGAGQARAVRTIVDETPGLALKYIRPDLQDIPRVVVAERTRD